LSFLLWTIAVFGDPEIDFDGLLTENWRNWWKATSDDLRIAASWGAAFDIYATEEENRPIMVSYGTSPAYDVCHPLWGVGYGNPAPSKAIVSHENNLRNAWLQIEGIGLVKNAPHEEEAKQFIDWFLSTDLQDNIAMNNWMYPANIYSNISSCFSDIAINPNDVDILNNLIQPSMIEENLQTWKSDWEAEIAPFSSLFAVMMSLIFATTCYSLIRKRKK
jgi:thiamine transport system substrate-binding protein